VARAIWSSDDAQLRDRNRRVVRILLAVMAVLVASAVVVGIRW
jgi:hypothetical protein